MSLNFVTLVLFTHFRRKQRMPEGQPLSTAKRPLFFQHVPNMPKGNMSDEQHAHFKVAEETRTKHLMDTRCVVEEMLVVMSVLMNTLLLHPFGYETI